MAWSGPLPGTWRSLGPFEPGVNDLEIEVANLWPNRLIGDAAFAEGKTAHADQRQTYDTLASGSRLTRLLPSGLLGPVTLRIQDVISP